MTDQLQTRDMEMTAELIRERLWEHPEVDLIRSAGVPVTLGYKPTAVWLQVGEKVVADVAWIGWWDGRLATREDQAEMVAHRLLSEWTEGQRRRRG